MVNIEPLMNALIEREEEQEKKVGGRIPSIHIQYLS